MPEQITTDGESVPAKEDEPAQQLPLFAASAFADLTYHGKCSQPTLKGDDDGSVHTD